MRRECVLNSSPAWPRRRTSQMGKRGDRSIEPTAGREAAGGAGQQQGEAGRRQLLVVVEQRSLRRAVPVGLDAQEAARQHQAVEEQQAARQFGQGGEVEQVQSLGEPVLPVLVIAGHVALAGRRRQSSSPTLAGAPQNVGQRFGEQCRAPRRLHGQQVGAEPVRTVGREQQAAQQLGLNAQHQRPGGVAVRQQAVRMRPGGLLEGEVGAAPLLAEGVDGVAEGDLAEAQGLAAADRGAAEHPVEAADPGALDRRQRRGVGGPQAKHNFPARLARLRLRLRRHRQRVLALQRHPVRLGGLRQRAEAALLPAERDRHSISPNLRRKLASFEGGILHEAQQPVQPVGVNVQPFPAVQRLPQAGPVALEGVFAVPVQQPPRWSRSSSSSRSPPRTDDWDTREDAFQRDRTRLWESLNSRKRLDVDSNGAAPAAELRGESHLQGGQLPAQSDRVALKREDTLPMPAEAEAEPSQPRRKIVLGLRPAYTAPLPPIQRSGVGSFHRMLGGAPIGRGEALRLRQVTFGNAVHPFCKERPPGRIRTACWRTATPTRALVLCVQAQAAAPPAVPGRLSGPVPHPPAGRGAGAAPDTARRIFWPTFCGAPEGRRAALAAPSSECHVPSDDQYREDGFTERLHLFYFTSLPELLDGLRRSRRRRTRAALLLLYCLVLSRGFLRIQADWDGAPKASLLNDNEELATPGFTLLLTGAACRFLHNGCQLADPETGAPLPAPRTGLASGRMLGA
uniref:Ubiquitin carboxyl-terminal hydrolase MINDY n=1 Tax=Macrostomum lignano TaxID=282301 RepID=A0A1I8FC31_9PLAT